MSRSLELSTSPGRPLVAIVDDDPRILQSLEDLFRSAGLGVRVFRSGAELLSSGTLDEVNCLIADIRMPHMDGWELHRRVLSSHPGLPFIFLTAHESEAAQQRALSRGAFAIFSKPFDAEELLRAVEKAAGELRSRT